MSDQSFGGISAQGSVRKPILQLAGTAVAVQVLNIAAAPVLTRMYSPAQFGVLGLAFGLFGILSPAVVLQLENAVPLPRADRDANLLVRFGIRISVVVAAAMAGIVYLVFLIAEPAGLRSGALGVAEFCVLLGLALATFGIGQAQNALAIRHERHRYVVFRNGVQGGSQSVLQVVFGAFRASSAGLVGAFVASRALGAAAAARGIRALRREPRDTEPGDFPTVWSALRRYRKFPLLASWSAVINAFALGILPYAVGLRFTGDAVGFVALSIRFLGLPMAVLGQAVLQVSLGRQAALARRSAADHLRYFDAAVRRLVVVSLLVLAVVEGLVDLAVPIALGEEWNGSITSIRILAPVFAFQLVAAPLSQTLNILERQEVQFVWDLTRSIAVIGVFVLGDIVDASLSETLLGYSIVMTITYAILLVISRQALVRGTNSRS